MESEDFLLRAHTKGHRRLCRRVIFNKHQKGLGIDNSESFLAQACKGVPSFQKAQPFGTKPRALRLEAVHITREHGCLADVIQL